MNAEAKIEQATMKGDKEPPQDGNRQGSRLADIPRGDIVGLFAVLAALAWAYAPNFVSFYRLWMDQPDYTHGFLVVPISLFILWKRWPGPGEKQPAPWWPGWALVVAGLVMRAGFLENGQIWLESATLLLVVTGLGLARLGPETMRKVWPAFAFLIFLYPLPTQVNTSLAQPLQYLATTCACALLRLTGLWVMPEGNVIMVGNERLEVAAACNGLSMLMSLAATVTATASLVPMTTLKRIALLTSIVPIALASNVLRIAATAWCYYKFGAVVGSKYAHDAAGWLMMPTAMVLVFLELSVISWLIVESDEDELSGDRISLGIIGGPPNPNFGGPIVTGTTWVWGLPLARMTRSEAADTVMDLIEVGRPSFFITANTHYAMLTAERPELRPINDRAAFILADGAPMVWASRRGPAPLPERVAGSDLIYDLCERASKLGRSIYLLGGADGIADEASRKLQSIYPGLRVVGTACPPPGSLVGDGCRQVIAEIRAAKPDLLLVAFGQPKGELWINEHLDELGVPVCVQVGATLDFVAGRVRRAPLFFQKTGLEWAFRIYTDPARLFPRYSKNAIFLFGSVARDLMKGKDRQGVPGAPETSKPTPAADVRP